MKYYSTGHEWVFVDGDEAYVGVTQYLADHLGDLSYIEISKEGTDVIVGDSIGALESIANSSDIYSPISGTITAVNENIAEDPTILNHAAEERKSWLCKLENTDLAELEDLMTAEEYKKYLKKLKR